MIKSSLRSLVDFSLKKNLVIKKIRQGMTSKTEYCDADFFLQSAASYYGVTTDENCPICQLKKLVQVSWIFGDSLKHASGSARTQTEIAALSQLKNEFTVHVVEVCSECGWNYLLYSYRTGLVKEEKSSGKVKV